MSKTPTRKGVVAGQAPDAPAAAALSPDWEAIDRKYRAGVLSVREIAKQHGLSHTAIQHKAAREGWQRDLSGRVREAVATRLVATAVANGNAATERQLVDEAAAQVVLVVREHRKDVAAGRTLVSTLLSQLESAAGARDVLEGLIEEETAEADDPEAKGVDRAFARARRNQMLKAIALPQHAATIRDLATAMSKLVALERQAFNVDTLPPEAPDDGVSPSQAALDAFEQRLAELTRPDAPAPDRPAGSPRA